MRKYLAPIVICLIGGLAFALAQNINKALQLSQDSTGAFGIDTNNNVYFPAHILNNGPGTPTVVAAAGTTPTIIGTDNQGTISGGTAGTTSTLTLTFNKAFLAAPACMLASQNPAVSPLAYNVAPTGINITTGVGAAVVQYLCMGAK